MGKYLIMEERLKIYFQLWNKTSKNSLKPMHTYSPNTSLNNPEYLIARLSGLTIAEAKDALILAEEIRKAGIEKVMAKWALLGQKLSCTSISHKRWKGKNSICRDSQPIKRPRM
ncbi:unnamed protein product [Blepharisma stoltei]|uniref:Ribosomal protein S13 n=1 Tax=Blepharisma stoltei TaxID=1481888 RepID=A0AAU9J061_9CILI|nr:unnamed protein product [Blepharisma stoltei]